MPSINRLMGHRVQKLVISRNGLKTTEGFTDSLTLSLFIVTQKTIFLSELKCNVQ